MEHSPRDSTPQEAATRTTTFPVALAVAIVARCFLPTLLRCFGSTDASADTLEELLSCTYTILALMLFSQHAQQPKGGSPAPSVSPVARPTTANQPGGQGSQVSEAQFSESWGASPGRLLGLWTLP